MFYTHRYICIWVCTHKHVECLASVVRVLLLLNGYHPQVGGRVLVIKGEVRYPENFLGINYMSYVFPNIVHKDDDIP
jgi:hypothetical protein